MRLFNKKDDAMFLTRKQWKKVFLATTIITLCIYTIALICSLCGVDYFIIKYQNDQMDRIEKFLRTYRIYGLFNLLLTSIEFTILLGFVLKKIPNVLYVLSFFLVGLAGTLSFLPDLYFNIYPFAFYLVIPIIHQLIKTKKFSFKQYCFSLIRVAIVVAVSFGLQGMILGIKAGYYDGLNHKLTLSAQFIYEVEYLFALLIILYTIHLYLEREKGDSKLWAMESALGGSSQISKMQLQKSNLKNLSKKQKNKLRLFYVKIYLIQLGTFLLVMILPFVCGKVLEFLLMYLSFAVVRALLGFKYSLHYKKEVMCVAISVIIFGILCLAVPFFYVDIILAVSLGVGLAIALHLSYKYEGLFIFAKVAKPDKFALLYTYFDGDLSELHVKSICFHKNLDKDQTNLIWDYLQGDKISYLSNKYNYSLRMVNYKLDQAIDTLCC